MGNYKETKSFYLVKKMSTKHKELLYKAIEDNDFVCLAQIANVLIGSRILFGQYIEGDEFKFFANFFYYYEPTRESLDKIFNDEEYVIMDENSKVYTAEDIWKIVDECKDGMNNEKLSEKWSDEERCMFEANEWESYFGIGVDYILKYKPRFYEFHNEGLRFSIVQ